MEPNESDAEAYAAVLTIIASDADVPIKLAQIADWTADYERDGEDAE